MESDKQSMLEVINNEILPRALMMGVNYDLFWTLNPKSLSPFIKAFELSQKNMDFFAWQSGLYIRSAIGSLLDKKNEYPKKPFSDNSLTLEEQIEEDANARMRRIKQKMMERMIIINKKFEEKGELLNE